MTTSLTFKSLAKFISYKEKTFDGVEKYVVSYTQPNSKDPDKVRNHNAISKTLTDESINKLVTMQEGDLYCTHNITTAEGWPEVIGLSDVKDVPVKTEGNKGAFFKGGSKPFVPKDDTGITVGAAVKDAIETIRLGKELGVTNKEAWKMISELTDEIITGKMAKEAKLRAQKAKEAPTTVKVAEEAKPLSRAEQAKAKQTTKVEIPIVDSDLDEVQFGE